MLFEMIAGRRPFPGSDAVQLVTSVLRDEAAKLTDAIFLHGSVLVRQGDIDAGLAEFRKVMATRPNAVALYRERKPPGAAPLGRFKYAISALDAEEDPEIELPDGN